MKKSIEKKFLDFKNRNSLSNEIITKMITEYANSSLEFARSYFANEYGISHHVFYKARDYAVILGFVDNEICKKLCIKTATNCKNNNTQSSNRASLSHFNELMNERQRFLSRFSEKDIQDIGYKYISGVSVKKIAIAYDIGEYTIRCLLRKGVVELIYDGDIVKILVSMLGSKMDAILEKREKNKQILLECLALEIKCLKQRLKCNAAYNRISHKTMSNDDVSKQLSSVMEMYNKALKF